MNLTIRFLRICSKNKQSLPNLAAEQGLNGGWEFAKLSFPC